MLPSSCHQHSTMSTMSTVAPPNARPRPYLRNGKNTCEKWLGRGGGWKPCVALHCIRNRNEQQKHWQSRTLYCNIPDPEVHVQYIIAVTFIRAPAMDSNFVENCVKSKCILINLKGRWRWLCGVLDLQKLRAAARFEVTWKCLDMQSVVAVGHHEPSILVAAPPAVFQWFDNKGYLVIALWCSKTNWLVV